MSNMLRCSRLVAAAAVTFVIALTACGVPQTSLSYGVNELQYTSAVLEEEAAQIGQFLFETSGVNIGAPASVRLDKNGIRVQTGSGARQWHFTYSFQIAVQGQVGEMARLEADIRAWRAGLLEQVFESETREIKRIVQMSICESPFEGCAQVSEP